MRDQVLGSGESPSSLWRGATCWAAGLLLAAPWGVLWWCLSEFHGWPLNDDPFYAKPLAFWSTDGQLLWVRQYGELTASSVTHVLTGLLGTSRREFSYRPLFVVCIFQQALGAWGLFWIARRLGLVDSFGLLAAFSLSLFPLYFGHGFTFMTDGPATAWASIASVLLVWGYLQNNWRWLCAGSFAVGWGYWMRQTNGLLLLAPLAAMLFARWFLDASKRPQLTALGAVVCVALAAGSVLEFGGLLSSSLDRLSDVAPQAEGYWRRVAIAFYGVLLLFGWLVLPWLPTLWRESLRCRAHLHRWQRWSCDTAAIVVLGLGAFALVASRGKACITNATGAFVQNAHFGPIFLSDMDEPGRWGQLDGVAWPIGIWTILSAFAIVSSALLTWWGMWTLVSDLQNRSTEDQHKRAIAVGILVMFVASCLLVGLFIEPHMDRYWMFLFPPLLTWCLLLAVMRQWTLDRGSLVWALLCLFTHAGISVAFTHDMLAWNSARWDYLNAYLASGSLASSIDAGRDANAWLRMDEDVDTHARQGDDSKWWSGKAKLCLAVGDRKGWEVIHSIPWSAWATGGTTHHIRVLQRVPETRLEAREMDGGEP